MLRDAPDKQRTLRPIQRRKRRDTSFLPCLALAMLALGPAGCDSPTTMKKSSALLIEVSAADAAAAGLPAVEVRVAQTKLPLLARPLPFAGAYVSASGPPGGPLGLTVTAGAANVEEAAKTLRDTGHEDRSEEHTSE